MRYTSLCILFCFFALVANANQRIFEAIITVDSLGNAVKSKERLTVPDDWYVIEGLNGRALVRDGNKIYNIYKTNGYINVRSTYDGLNWSAPNRANDINSLVVQQSLGNPFAIGFAQKGATRNVVVVWISKIDTVYNILASVSSDDGKTFSLPITIHKDINREYRYISVAQDQNGGLFCVWTNKRENDTNVYIWSSKTTDGGATWSASIPTPYSFKNSTYYYRTADASSCDGISLTVFAPGDELNVFRITSQGTSRSVIPFTGDSSAYVQYRYNSLWRDNDCGQHCFYTTNILPFYTCLLHRYSSDNGSTWTDTSRLLGIYNNGSQNAEDGRPSVVFTPSGKMYVLISSYYDLYLYQSTDKGHTWKSSTISKDSTFDSNVAPSIAYIGSKNGIDSLLIVWEDYRELPKSVHPIIAVSFNAKVYPNPAKDKIQVALELSEPQRLAFVITDVLGKNVYEQEPQLYSVGIETVELPIDQIHTSGIYFLRITTDKGEQTIQRIAVEK